MKFAQYSLAFITVGAWVFTFACGEMNSADRINERLKSHQNEGETDLDIINDGPSATDGVADDAVPSTPTESLHLLPDSLAVSKCSLRPHPFVDKRLFAGDSLITAIPRFCCQTDSILYVDPSCYPHLRGRINWQEP